MNGNGVEPSCTATGAFDAILADIMNPAVGQLVVPKGLRAGDVEAYAVILCVVRRLGQLEPFENHAIRCDARNADTCPAAINVEAVGCDNVPPDIWRKIGYRQSVGYVVCGVSVRQGAVDRNPIA